MSFLPLMDIHCPTFSSSIPLSSFSGCAKAGGVRFSEKPPAASAPSHVHFDEKLHDSVVMVTPEDDGNFLVKVCLTYLTRGSCNMQSYPHPFPSNYLSQIPDI